MMHLALNLAENQPARMILWRIANTLGELEHTQGNIARATDLDSTAQYTLEYVINHIPEGELRSSFMAMPDVKQVLS